MSTHNLCIEWRANKKSFRGTSRMLVICSTGYVHLVEQEIINHSENLHGAKLNLLSKERLHVALDSPNQFNQPYL